MKKTGKIEKFKLGPKVLDLHLKQSLIPEKISAQLKAEGFPILEPKGCVLKELEYVFLPNCEP